MNPNTQRIILRQNQGWEAHNEFGDVGGGSTQNDAIAQCLGAWLTRLNSGIAAMIPTPEQEAMWAQFVEMNGVLIFETKIHFTPFADGPTCECAVMVQVTISRLVGWHRVDWTAIPPLVPTVALDDPPPLGAGETLLVDRFKGMPP